MDRTDLTGKGQTNIFTHTYAHMYKYINRVDMQKQALLHINIYHTHTHTP